MKLSDYVIDFLVRRGVTHVFGISGGAAVHLFDSADRHPGMDYVCSQHEQSSAMSADGYARATGRLGVAITTSGPGATNLLTGVCCSFYDSVPTLMITGQVATHRLKGDRPVRQVGFQETDVVSIFASVTKYAHQISDPNSIRYHLEKAYYLAFEGRPGAVLIDLPDDRPGPAADDAGFVDAYDFVERLAAHAPDDEQIFIDTGGNLTWTCNGFRTKQGQKLISAWNNTPMGYALPAAIGAAAARESRGITCVIGDGGLVLCLGELSTLVAHGYRVRVILFNNHGHGIQKQTLETWLGGRYVGVHGASGLAFPDFAKVAEAMGLQTVTIDRSSAIDEALRHVYSGNGPVFCNVEINPSQKLYPVLKFGAPLESQLPSLDDRWIEQQMIIPPFRPTTAQKSMPGTAGV